jgi:carbonic anhydrase/acetyltransferase-like protein (isoleucine patch superfamily)
MTNPSVPHSTTSQPVPLAGTGPTFLSSLRAARAKWNDNSESALSSSRIRRARAYAFGLVRGRFVLRGIEGRGRDVRVNGRAVITNDGWMRVGAGSVLRGIPTAVELATGPLGRLSIGRRAIINSGASICAYGQLTIGDRVLIGPYAMISDTSFHDLYDRDVVPESLAVVIEDDVWIGAKASVLPGVKIGRGAVVSAHALVNRDVAAFAIVSGVPAVEIARLNPKKFSVRNDA